MPPQVRSAPSARAGRSQRRSASTKVLSRNRSGPSHAGVSAMAAPSAPEGRRLRSRVVPAPSTGSVPTVVRAGFVEGRRRSRSAASSRTSETDTCNLVTTRVNTRTLGRPCTSSQGSRPSVQTRSAGRANRSARMSLGSGLNLRRLGTRTQAEQTSVAVMRPQRTTRDRSVRSGPSRTLRKSPFSKSAAHERERPSKCVVQQQPSSCEVADCLVKLMPLDMDKHLTECNSCLPCPLAHNESCKWKGAISHMASHIVLDHRSINCRTGPNITLTLKNWRRVAPIHWITLQACLGQNFLVTLQKIDRNKCAIFCGSVYVLGKQKDADRFEYRMLLRSRNNINRTFSYSTVIRVLHDTKVPVNEGDFFIFDSSYAEIFSHEDELEVEVSISVMTM